MISVVVSRSKGGQRGFQTAGGIQARPQHKANVARRYLADLHFRDTRQRIQSLPLGLADLAQSLADQGAVFADERGQVCDGAQGYQVEQICQISICRLAVQVLRERLGDLVGDTHSGQVFIGIDVAMLLGVDHGKRFGQVFAVRVVMVADNEVQADVRACSASFGERMPQSTVITSLTPSAFR